MVDVHLAALLTGDGSAERKWIGVLLVVLGEAISILFVLKILTSRKTPTATLLWVVVILLWPVLGIAFYYLFPHRLHLRRLKQRVARLASMSATPPSSPATLPPADSLCSVLQRVDPGSGAPGNELVLLESGAEFFTRLEAAIDQARSFVHLETYILRPDGAGQRVLARLGDAARRGVEVRLLYDHIGSWSLKERHVGALRAAGGSAVSYLPLLWRRRPFTLNLRNHRKLCIIDGTLAYLGGRNIADEYANDRFGNGATWFDLMVQVRGPAVRLLNEVFVEDWCNASDEELSTEKYFPLVDPAGESWVGTVTSGPDRESNVLRSVLFEMIGQARSSLDISSPYLVPDEPILTALEVAAYRGVRIRLHTNGPKAEQFVLYHAARSLYHRLTEAGAEIIETTEDYNHTKLFIVDATKLYFGSANMDMRSFALNFELGALVLDREVCARARRLFEDRCGRGRTIDPTSLPIGRAGRVVDGACRMLSPLL